MTNARSKVRPTSLLIRSVTLRANAVRSPRNEPVSVAAASASTSARAASTMSFFATTPIPVDQRPVESVTLGQSLDAEPLDTPAG
jgi:hypothetical protein